VLRAFGLMLVFCCAPLAAAEPSSAEALTPFVRSLLLQALPQPLGQSQGNWGQQHEVVVGMKWHKLKPEPMRSLRNDGLWQKARAEAIDPAHTLSFRMDSVEAVDANTTRFVATLGMEVRAVQEQQLWKSGVRLYSGEVRGRCHVAIRVVGEMNTKFERPAGQLLPTATVRVRLTEADVNYDHLVCEHILGMNGQPAKLTGDVMLKLLRQVKPGWETAQKDKANAMIVKAADTKEVRVELDKLFPGANAILKP
jgi:hypothetical protein